MTTEVVTTEVVTTGVVTTAGVRPTDTSAADRIQRVFGRFISAGFGFYLFFIGPAALSQAHLTPSWWTPVALVAIFGTALGLGLATFLPDVQWVARMSAANAIAYLLVVASWWFVRTGGSADVSAWQALCPGVAGLSAAAAWRPRVALGYLVVVVVLVQGSSYMLLRDTIGYRLVPELAFALLFCGVFVAAAIMAMRTGRILDKTIATTHESVVGAAAARARTVERERFDALVHDQVMSTLLAAGRGGSEQVLAMQARRALDIFDSLRRGHDNETAFEVEQALAQFRSAASEIDEDVVFTSDVVFTAGDRDTVVHPYPPEPVRAIAAALAEAVRNSVRHAGPDTVRKVHVDARPGLLRVTVADDGCGFDPSSVDPHRMGLRASIHGRMAQLDGGAARVASSTGAGTTVTLTWTEPERAGAGRAGTAEQSAP